MQKIAEGVRSTHNQDGGIVLDVRQGKMFRLNLVGSRILALLEAGYQELRISEELSRQFGISLEIVEADVHEFLGMLEKHRLLEQHRTCSQV